MQVLQKLSLRPYRRASKTDKEGYAPIYCKVTIDGVEDMLPTGIKVQAGRRDKDTKSVDAGHPHHKNYNKRLRQVITDLERHFDLVIAQNGIALPAQVIESYQTPVNGAKMREERQANADLSQAVDQLAPSIIQYFTLLERAESHRLGHNMEQIRHRLEQQKTELDQRLGKLVKTANKIFNDKSWARTFMLAMDESLIYFLQQVMAGKCSYNTLKKSGTRKTGGANF